MSKRQAGLDRVGSTVATRRRATSYDVAVAAGVAQSTVSRCFVADSQISAVTRARVQEVAASLGYVPNAIARSLITRRSELVAVIVTSFTLRANPAIVSGLGRALNGRGKQLLLMAVDDGAGARAAAQAALRYPLDGLVVATTLDDVDMKPLLARGVPIVSFNRPASWPRVDRIATDHAGAAREAARLLYRAGHRRFLCVGGPPWASVNQERADGFLAELDALGVTRAAHVTAEQSYAGGRQAFCDYVAANGAPEAVFCVNDPLAFGVLDACRFELDLSVPADISVIGFDDVAEAAHQSYDLTTVRQDVDAMAEGAVELLMHRLDAPDARARRLLLPGTLIRRGSARI